MYKYFGFCPDNGFETFKTLEEAKAYAESSLEYYRGEAGDGWDEQVDQICWGEIKQDVKMSEYRAWEKEDGPGEFDYYADYALGDVDQTFKLDK